MSELTVTLIVISLPGITCMFVLARLAGKREHSSLETVFLVFVYSVFSYLIYSLFCVLWNGLTGATLSCGICQMLCSGSYRPSPEELLGGAISAVPLSFALAAAHRYNVLNLVAQKIGVSNRYGDDDVWHFFHNAPLEEKNGGWVFVRDHKQDLVYYGYINTWSDSAKQREIVMSDVSVFDNKSGEELYSTKLMYISRNPDDLTIEVPDCRITGANDDKRLEADESH